MRKVSLKFDSLTLHSLESFIVYAFIAFGNPGPRVVNKGLPHDVNFGLSSSSDEDLQAEQQIGGPIGLPFPPEFQDDDDLESPFSRPGAGERYRLLQQYLLGDRLRYALPGTRRPHGTGFYSVSINLPLFAKYCREYQKLSADMFDDDVNARSDFVSTSGDEMSSRRN
jgi:hypothetical protein